THEINSMLMSRENSHEMSVLRDLSMQCELCRFDGPMKPWYADFGIVKCPECDLIFFAANQVSTEKLYGEEYFKGREYQDYVQDKKVIKDNFQKLIEDLRRL